jgi:hypothetical protein
VVDQVHALQPRLDRLLLAENVDQQEPAVFLRFNEIDRFEDELFPAVFVDLCICFTHRATTP